jgi:hypothetical protein
MTAAVDASRWPVVVVVIDEQVPPEAAAEVTDALDDVLRRREPLGFVFDYQRGEPAVQEAVSMWLAQRVDALRALVRGAVTVVPAERVEHVRSLIDSGMFTMPFDSWATATVDEGIAWVRSCLGVTDGADDREERP